MRGERLSALDASFLSVETPTAHMHVGWVAMFSAPEAGPPPCFAEVRDHIEARLGRAPRYRQKLAPVPLGLHSPEWVDDPSFSVERHVYWAPGPLGEIVDEVMSMPLRRDRPLWEIWVCEDAGNDQMALVGKMHHCMVDGIAAVELGSLLLDPTPERTAPEHEGWSISAAPDGMGLFLDAVWDRLGEQLGMVRWPLRAVRSPAGFVSHVAGAIPRVGRALAHSFGSAPDSPLNTPISPSRHLVWAQRPFDDLRKIKRANGTSVNDVLLAAVAGGVRRFTAGRGWEPGPLKAMVPVNVREDGEAFGNRVSFVFAELPCEEQNPVRRLHRVASTMTQRKQDREFEGADLALKAAALTPTSVQHAIAKAVASPRTFNLIVSNIPGPAQRLYMKGCPLTAAYPVVPLADKHALSIGMTSVCDRMCLGVYADHETIPDAQLLVRDIDAAITELLETAS